MSQYQVKRRDDYMNDDGLAIDMGALQPKQAWWEVPLPPCPDCGGDLVWYEAGYVPGTRKCMGMPVGGPPTNPVLDVRVPLPNSESYRGMQGAFPTGEMGDRARALFAERNTCTDDRVKEIDRELIALLSRWTKLEYEEDGGCGSLFSVHVQDGHVIVRRERFY